MLTVASGEYGHRVLAGDVPRECEAADDDELQADEHEDELDQQELGLDVVAFEGLVRDAHHDDDAVEGQDGGRECEDGKPHVRAVGREL